MRRTWKIHKIGGADGKKESKKIFTFIGNVNAELFNMEQYIISKSRR